MRLYYDADADVYYAESLNVFGADGSTNVPEDDAIERDLHKRYPLLSQKRIDGYTDAQIARGLGVSLAEEHRRMDAERREAAMDPMLKAGPGKALLA